MKKNTYKLIADFGGTHMRIALSDGSKVFKISKIRYKKDISPIHLISNFLLDIKSSINSINCFRICAAGPVEDGNVNITNSNLVISRNELMEFFNIRDIEIFNDAEAACYFIPHIKKPSYATLNSKSPKNSTFGYIALGTGLGVSAIKLIHGKSIIISGEGGYCHIPYPEKNTISSEVISLIEKDYPRISCERLISGPGILLIYNALSKINKTSSKLSSEKIVNYALKNSQGLEFEACKILFELLAKFAASVALIYGARGGLFLGGGLLQRLLPIMPKEILLSNFLISGRMKDYVHSIPLYTINDDLISLKGCAIFES